MIALYIVIFPSLFYSFHPPKSIHKIQNKNTPFHKYIKQYKKTYVVCIVIQELNKYIIRTNYARACVCEVQQRYMQAIKKKPSAPNPNTQHHTFPSITTNICIFLIALPINSTVKTMIYSIVYVHTYAHRICNFNQMETKKEWKKQNTNATLGDSLWGREKNDDNIRKHQKIYRSISLVYFIHTIFC